MNELEIFSKMSEISDHPQEASLLFQDDERAQLIAEHIDSARRTSASNIPSGTLVKGDWKWTLLQRLSSTYP